jgi:MinD-like ATPase involved in chromosome partitioning or flagellar assembly
MTISGTRPQIFTFYSFKGGVGRTLLAANVSKVIERWGHRVLMIDWDLEAPGLHHYFRSSGSTDSADGVVELIQAFDRGEDIDAIDYVTHLRADVGRLDFISAGNQSEAYVEAVQNLNFDRLFEKGFGELLETLRASWKEQYDIVLIDSRTGLSDVAGICTVQLPDVIVPCFTTSDQSLDGSLRIARLAVESRSNFARDRERPLVLPVLSRYESNVEYDLLVSWLSRIDDDVAPFTRDWLPRDLHPSEFSPNLRIPYIPHWSFGESLAVNEEDGRDPRSLSFAIQGIAALIARGLDDADLLMTSRSSYISSATRTRRHDQIATGSYPADIAIVHSADDADLAMRLSHEFTRHKLRSIRQGSAASAAELPEQARHIVFIVGSREDPGIVREARRLVLDVLGSETERLLVTVVNAPRLDAVPTQLRSFQWISAWQRNAADVARDVINLIRPGDDVEERQARTSQQLGAWLASSRDRFYRLVNERGASERYAHGTWEIAYEVLTTAPSMSLPKLRDVLIESVGHETGWPVWWWPDSQELRPRIFEDAIECWLYDTTFADPVHSDFWRASPESVLYLLRGYDEDSGADVMPGQVLDPYLPIWRTGEAMLHAARFASNNGERATPITFDATWTGLAGRILRPIRPSRRLWSESSAKADQGAVHSRIEATAEEIADDLPRLVQDLLRPLYVVFDFFEMPLETVKAELDEMRQQRR